MIARLEIEKNSKLKKNQTIWQYTDSFQCSYKYKTEVIIVFFDD